MEESPDEVANMVKEWAIGDMRYPGQWDAEQMRSLCSGPISSIWTWLSRNCRTDETVSMVLGNLCLARRLGGRKTDLSLEMNGTTLESGDREFLLSEQTRLTEELHAMVAKVKRLTAGLKEQEKESKRMVEERKETMDRVNYQRQRSTLLGLYVKQVNSKIEKLGQIASRFEDISARKESGEVKEGKVFSSGKGIECEEEKATREAVGLVGKEIKTALDGSQGVEGEKRKEARSAVEKLSKNVRPGLLLNLLQDQVAEATRQVKRKGDVKDLEEKRKRGAVRKEVAELCKQHILGWQKVQHAEAALAKLEKLDLESSSNQSHMGSVTKRQREAITLRESLKELIKRRNEVEMVNKAGLLWKQRVQEQENQIQQLSAIISVLVARDHLGTVENVQKKTLSLLSLLQYEADRAVTSMRKLLGSVTLQSQALQGAPTSLMKLSLVQSSDSSYLLPAVNLGIYRRSDCHPPHIGALSARMEEARSKEKIPRERNSGALLALEQNASDLRRQLRDGRNRQEAEFLPMLAQAELKRAEAEARVVAVGESRDDWRRQDASVVAEEVDLDWGQVAGRTLTAVVGEVRVAVAKTNNVACS